MSILDNHGMQDPSDRHSLSRFTGIGLVILLHIAIIYALVNALAHRSVEVVRAPIETKIIDQPQQEKVEPPPPPPVLAAPPPPFVPPPEVNIERPAPVQSTAPTVVTTVKPPAPAPVAAPVQVMPKLDAAHSREPEYPPQSRRLGEQGSVVLSVLVGTDGRVLDAKLVQTSGFPRLDEAALDGIKTNYRFTPGTLDGKPQQLWYTFRFTWKLR